MVEWPRVDTVLLDMDGTLLDLHFDNHFWQVHVPTQYAEKNALSFNQALDELIPRFRAAEGSLDWYCVDYWSRELDLDIAELKKDLEHLINVRPEVSGFLGAVRERGCSIALVTNAHNKSLTLKLNRTRIDRYFDLIVSAHDLGAPKEQPEFWHALQGLFSFDPPRSLFIDDSLPILRAARDFGIGQVLGVRHPDSKGPPRDTGEFAAIVSFADIIPPEKTEPELSTTE